MMAARTCNTRPEGFTGRGMCTVQPLIDQPGPYQTVFFVVLGLCAVPAALATVWLRARPDTARRDRGSFFGIQLLAGAGVFAAYWLSRHYEAGTITIGRTELFALGVAFIPLGALLNAVAIRQLGRYFTVQVAVRHGQPVIDTGPYRLVRHPAYSGQLLAMLGVALAFTNWAALIVLPVLALTGYGYRIHVEERALRQELGAPYEAYMARTRRLIPYVY